jgi:hypothetical protein
MDRKTVVISPCGLGWAGPLFFLFQAPVAIWQLVHVNYVEHYGLTRQHLGDGHYDYACSATQTITTNQTAAFRCCKPMRPIRHRNCPMAIR